MSGAASIDGLLITVEQVAEFCASRFRWTYDETMNTPAFLVWRLWRAAIEAAEEAKRGNNR